MQIKNSSNTYCIIGDPIQHSLSPAMQNAAFNALGLNS
jgi:shikimate dehydrogenase